jgi:ribosomal protein L11 methyltransferase
MNYKEYTFTVQPPEPGSEILIAIIADLGFESFETNPNGFVAYIPENLNPDDELKTFEFPDFTFSYSVKTIEQVNWNEEWEKNFQPVIVNDDCCIRAPFHKLEKNYKYDIIIMPKMSFGTGHHDTTWLMCKNMLEENFPGKNVLDMGCGTGVLAILAHKLGAATIKGIDIDDWSVENAIENCEANNCNQIEIVKGNSKLLTKEKEFDIILANINKNVLKADMPSYVKSLKPGGSLFISGFFKTDIDELIKHAESLSLSLSKQEIKNEWACLVFKV